MKKTEKREIKRAAEVVKRLKAVYPGARCSLNYTTPHELLVATILSAQCTDERVNQVTRKLFEKYKTSADFAYCDVNELAKDIYSCGYHNQKAKSIKGASLNIVEYYHGEVPDTVNELIKLPGVGRKTANCVLGECFGVPAMVIDTHMVRILSLLGFTDSRDARKIEFEMMKLFEEQDWVKLTHLVINHGRKVCIANRPKCDACVLNDICPSTR